MGAGSVSIKAAGGSVADLKCFVDPGLAAGTVLAGDRQAATYYEAAGVARCGCRPSTSRTAASISACSATPADLLNDARGLVKQAVTAGATALAADSAPRGRK